MNILLFSEDEWAVPLKPEDYRAIHIRDQLALRKKDVLRVGRIGKGIGFAQIMNEPGSGRAIELNFPQELTRTIFPAVHLIIGHPRPPVFRRLVKDLASMGVSQISWVHTSLGEKSYLASRVWQPDAIERQLHLGLEQGAHTNIPLMYKFYSLDRCLEELKSPKGRSESSRHFVLHPPAKNRQRMLATPPALHQMLANLLTVGATTAPLTMAIGPERGWTQGEIKALQAWGFVPAHLGQAILRSETAALLAGGMALLYLQEMEEWKG